VIEHLYKTTAERADALRRHLVFFNSEPQFGALVPAAVVAMEEEHATGSGVSEEAINGVKSSLMGPLAGVGDSLIQGLVTPLLLSLGISLALQGSFAGPPLYVGMISAIVVGANRAFWQLGYRWGRAAVSRVLASGWVQALTEGAAVTGMTVAGALIATVVRVSTPVSVNIGETAVSLQTDILDAILINLLPLSLSFGVWWLLERRVPSMRVIGGLFVLGILFSYLGFLGSSVPPLLSAEWFSYLVGGRPTTLASLSSHLWPLALTAIAAAALAVLWLFKGRR
jgi:PTS system mannose-specific IID component